MARPLSEDKRDAILASAAELVAALGTSAPTAKIARGAGVAEGTLFTYFPDKDALLAALQRRHLDELRRHLLARGPTDDPNAWLDWLVTELTELNTQPGASALWAVSRMVADMLDHVTALVDDLAAEAATVLGVRSRIHARAVVVTALAMVHDVVLPHPTPARRRVAIDAVRAVAGPTVTVTHSANSSAEVPCRAVE